MTQSLSLQSSSSNADFEARKTNQRLQPAQTELCNLPIALIKHAMGFLPFADLIMCKRVFKALGDLDYPRWMRLSGYAYKWQVQEYFSAKGDPSPESRAIAEIRNAGVHLKTMNLKGKDPFFRNSVVDIFKDSEKEKGEPRFPHLRELRFRVQHKDEVPVQVNNIVSNAPQVTELCIRGIGERDLQLFSPLFTRVERLWFEDYVSGRKDLSVLTKLCPKLKEFSLQTEDGVYFDEITKAPQLREASFYGGAFTGLFVDFEGHPTLQKLTFTSSEEETTLTEENFLSLARVPHLQDLCLGSFVCSDLSGLAGVKTLRRLELSCCGEGTEHIASLRAAKNIEELTICEAFSEEMFAAIGKCTHLRRLTLEIILTTSTLTDRALEHLSSCQELLYLKIRCHENAHQMDVAFTTQGVIDLVRMLPHLRLLDIDDKCFLRINPDEIEDRLSVTHPKLFVQKNRTL